MTRLHSGPGEFDRPVRDPARDTVSNRESIFGVRQFATYRPCNWCGDQTKNRSDVMLAAQGAIFDLQVRFCCDDCKARWQRSMTLADVEVNFQP